MRIISCLSLILLMGCKGVQNNNKLLIKNAQIIDLELKKIVQGHLLINDGYLEEVLTGEIESNSTIESIDLKNKYILPGLSDAHVHAFGNIATNGYRQNLNIEEVSRVLMAYGVLNYLDLYNAEDSIFKNRTKSRLRNTLPEIYCSGAVFTCTKGHGDEGYLEPRIADDVIQAREQFGDLLLKKPDVVKIIYDTQFRSRPSIKKDVLDTLIKLCNQNNIKSVVHIGTWVDAYVAAKSGCDIITHIPSGIAPDSVINMLKEKKVSVIPTFGIQAGLYNISGSKSPLDDPYLKRSINDSILMGYSSEYLKKYSGFIRWQETNSRTIHKNVQKLDSAGISLIAGTDAANPGVFLGYSLLTEIDNLILSGLDAWDALASATINFSTISGKKSGFNAGCEASYIVLDDSPVNSMQSLRNIKLIINKGYVIDRASLDSIFSEISDN